MSFMNDNIKIHFSEITNHTLFILDLGNPMSQNNLKTNNDTVMLRAMRNKKRSMSKELRSLSKGEWAKS